MIVCLCQNVNTRDLRECLDRGLTLEEVRAELGLGAGCGACLEQACQLLAAPAPAICPRGTQAA